jgi:hypothetical protein
MFEFLAGPILYTALVELGRALLVIEIDRIIELMPRADLQRRSGGFLHLYVLCAPRLLGLKLE